MASSYTNPEYEEALRAMDNAYRVFSEARRKANEAANGQQHFVIMDKYLFSTFLEKKAIADELAKEIHAGDNRP